MSGNEVVLTLIVLAVISLAIWLTRPGGTEFATGAAPHDVASAAIRSFTARGWGTTTQSDATVTFTRTQAPGCLIAIFLLLLGLIPGLIYCIAAKRTLSVSVASKATAAGGSNVIVTWSRNGGGRGPGLQFKRSVPPAPMLDASARSQPVRPERELLLESPRNGRTADRALGGTGTIDTKTEGSRGHHEACASRRNRADRTCDIQISPSSEGSSSVRRGTATGAAHRRNLDRTSTASDPPYRIRR